MSIQESVNEEIKSAMRNKDKFRVNSLKYIKSLFQNNNKTSNPQEDIDVLTSHHKKMSKSLEFYKDQAFLDLRKEIVIIEEFMPKAISEEEISSLVDKHLNLGNMGLVMKAVKADISGPFDGKLISSLVRSKLS